MTLPASSMASAPRLLVLGDTSAVIGVAVAGTSRCEVGTRPRRCWSRVRCCHEPRRRRSGRSRLPCSSPCRRAGPGAASRRREPGRRGPDRAEDVLVRRVRGLQATTIWPAALRGRRLPVGRGRGGADDARGRPSPHRRPPRREEDRLGSRAAAGTGPLRPHDEALPEGSIDANGWHPSPGRLLERPVGSVVQAPPGAVLRGADDALPADGLGPRLDPGPPSWIATDGRTRRGCRARERRRGRPRRRGEAGSAKASEQPQASATVRRTPSTRPA